MDSKSGTKPKKIYSLLSIGSRGVGKTVFLASSYADLHPNNQTNNPQQLWFDCQDSDTQKTLENVLSYVARTGQYPPATMKLTNFEFSLKQHTVWGSNQSLCHFRWWDTPGESCKLHNPAFQLMVLKSDGCCIFVDAHELVSRADAQGIKEILQPVKAITELVYQNGLKHPFALILTKCDLLRSHPHDGLILDERLRPLTDVLDVMKVNYKKFYSEIPIISTPNSQSFLLKSTQASLPVLWLLSEFRKTNAPEVRNNRPRTVPQANLSLNRPPVPKKYILVLALVLVVTVLGGFIAFSMKETGVNPEQNPYERRVTE